MRCKYKEYCEGEEEATHKCNNCGILYCDVCADNQQYQCYCIEDNIIPLDSSNIEKEKKDE